jgi:hypothetical protein
MHERGINRATMYREVEREEASLFKDVVRAHMDAGSMASTSDQRDYFYHLRLYPESIPLSARPRLKVADNKIHYAAGEGYLKQLVRTGHGFRMVKAFYTPSLPATIFSPDAMGRQFGCRGYVGVSNFDGQGCEFRLHHCRASPQDVVIDLTLIRGLLYTDPLIKPTTDYERTGPLVPPIHAVEKVRGPPPADDVDDDNSTASTVQAANVVSDPLVETVSNDDDDVASFAENKDATVMFPDACGCDSHAASVCACTRASGSLGPAPGVSNPDLPFDCHCCRVPEAADASTEHPCSETPNGDSFFLSMALKMELFQRTGGQFDVPIEDLHLHATGIPQFSLNSPSVCGHVTSDDTTADVNSLTLPQSHEYLDPEKEYELFHVSREQLGLLWHLRLAHVHNRRASTMHAHAHGIPKVPIASELDKCPVCAHAKLRKAARGKEDSRRATQPGQAIGVDMGFLVQSSSADSSRVQRLQGMHGETCYCLIVDHFSGRLYGETFSSKAPPIDFLNRWLLHHGLPRDVPDKYVRLDLGGELGNCREVVELFENAGYAVEPTAPSSSHQNGPCERPHQTIGDAIRTMLAGAALSPKFWPYAFHHFLRLYNVTPHGDKPSPFEIEQGEKPNLRYLRVFGCRVYALPSRPRRPDAAVSDSRVGIFLGYSKTMKNISV